MAAIAVILKREFSFNDTTLVDPGTHLSAKEVKDFYETKYPELMSAAIKKKVEDNIVKYEFVTKVPTNG